MKKETYCIALPATYRALLRPRQRASSFLWGSRPGIFACCSKYSLCGRAVVCTRCLRRACTSFQRKKRKQTRRPPPPGSWLLAAASLCSFCSFQFFVCAFLSCLLVRLWEILTRAPRSSRRDRIRLTASKATRGRAAFDEKNKTLIGSYWFISVIFLNANKLSFILGVENGHSTYGNPQKRVAIEMGEIDSSQGYISIRVTLFWFILKEDLVVFATQTLLKIYLIIYVRNTPTPAYHYFPRPPQPRLLRGKERRM